MNNDEIRVREDARGLVVDATHLRVTVSFHDAVSVVALAGRLVLGPECDALRYAVDVLGDRNRNRIVFDLGDLRYIDSAGLGLVVLASQTFENRGGRVCFSNSTRRISDLLQITRIATIAPMLEGTHEAVQSIAIDHRNDAI